MENKNVGYLLLGISAVVVGIVFMFQNTLKGMVKSSCTIAHGGDYCPMYATIDQQTYLALGIVAILILVGFVLVLSKPEEKVIVKTRTVERKAEKKDKDTRGLTAEEKKVLSIIQSNKTIFQADIIEKTGFGKAKMTRILDRLEGRGFIERKRRGMTNVVVLLE
ncbi:MarR family transcriptional regulator [Candidatus Pacearchaeota archaeon]|nr:MarR family transcriptional regulator [Candidatus Pacearchaeota archaeon]